MNALQTIRPELLTITPEQWKGLLPYFWVFGGTLLLIFVSVMKSLNPKWPVFILSLLTAIYGIYCSIQVIAGQLTSESTVLLFNEMMISDTFSSFFNIVFLSTAILTILSSFRYLDREKIQHPEYYVLVFFSVLGMMLMTSALDLIVLFIALETVSLAVYILVGFRRADRRCNEAAIKYFVLGAAASALLLYGTALLYGATGTTQIHTILTLLQSKPEVMTPLFTLGTWLVILGFLFKVASVPFHMWMPDVYEGAPTPVTGLMTTGFKTAAFATFLRVFISLGYGNGLSSIIQNQIYTILWISAVLTMGIGNFVALTQTNLKRMLAYSSIAHSGYLLVGLVTGFQSDQGYAPLVLYLVVYAIMNLGAFIVLTILANRNDTGLNLHDFSGLSRRHPWLAFAMAVFLFSMAGIPPTAGFTAKYLLFYSAVQAGEVLLVVISVLCSAVSVYYYLRVLVYMYMREPVGSPATTRISIWSSAALAAMVFLTLQIGLLPARMVSVAKKAVTSL